MEIRTLNHLANERIERSGERSRSSSTGREAQVEKGLFHRALLGAQERLVFSKHAKDRLNTMDKPIDQEELAKLEQAVNLAQSKGARSTLVLMKGVAFLVAPESRTVVTVIPDERMRENVFTSIDSAILADK